MTLPSPAVDIANDIRLRRSQYRGTFVIVEGSNDRLLYERFFDVQQCKFVIAEGKKKVCEVVRILDAGGFRGVLGIVDADFDLLDKIPASSLNVIWGDCHDLEAMLIRSPALDRILREFGSEDKIQRFASQTGEEIRHVLLNAATPLGYLRWHSLRSDLRLRFDGLLFSRFVDMARLAVDRTQLITTIKNHSQRQELDNHALELAIRGMEDPSHNLWQLCNGHDLVEVLSIGLRRAIGSQSAAAVRAENIERVLRLAYETVDFAASALYQALREWEQRNHPFRVLS